MERFVTVGVGRMTPEQRAAWEAQPEIAGIVRFEHGAADGRRLGKRALGLGIDSVVAALKAVLQFPRARFIAVNPWIALPLIAMGRDVSVTGIYAVAGSRGWKLLRRVIGARAITATVHSEVDAWNADGGNAALARYGASFAAPPRSAREGLPVRVFIGGSSDRDTAVIERLVAEVLDGSDVELVVATGVVDGPGADDSRVFYPGWIDPTSFARAVSESDVVFLPLKAGERAAGHMVAVSALESGVPVMTMPSVAMDGYVDGDTVQEIDPLGSVLEQLRRAALDGRRRGAEPYRAVWLAGFSAERAARNVLDAITTLRTTR